jgi:hypothetical protein
VCCGRVVPPRSVGFKITPRAAKSSPETRFEAVISLIQETGFSAEKNLSNFCIFYLNYQSTWNIKVLRLVTELPIRRRISGEEDHRKIGPEGFLVFRVWFVAMVSPGLDGALVVDQGPPHGAGEGSPIGKRGADSLVLGASRPLARQLHPKGFGEACLAGGGHDHSTNPLQGKQGGFP